MPNTQLVTAGQLKLRNGAPVEVIESQPVPAAKKAADKNEPAPPAKKNGKGEPAPAAKKDGT